MMLDSEPYTILAIPRRLLRVAEDVQCLLPWLYIRIFLFLGFASSFPLLALPSLGLSCISHFIDRLFRHTRHAPSYLRTPDLLRPLLQPT